MYMSRVALDLTKRATMLALQNPAMFHGAVERSFEPRAERSLWRIDELGGQRYLLLLSQEPPELSALAEQFGTQAAPETRDYAPLLARIAPGSRWQFRLHANPTYSSGGDGKRGKVHACTLVQMPESARPGTPEPKTQTGWLMRQAQAHGFSVREDEFGVKKIQWYAFGKENGAQVKLLGVTYEGILTVTDADSFREALVSGIGRGKAYGMGLLTVMRA